MNGDWLKNALQEFVERIDGLDTPIGGISIIRKGPQREAVFNLMTELADRRVLYHPDCMLSYENSRADLIGSTEKMRENIKQALKQVGPSSSARPYIKNMGEVCKDFQTFVERTYLLDKNIYTDDFRRQAIIRLRSAIGINLAALCRLYSLPVDDNFERIVPRGLLMLDGGPD